MKSIRTLFMLMGLILTPLVQTETSGWQGIVPLHSTRQDVEKVLGVSLSECKCSYKLGDDNVFVQYSGRTCSDTDAVGWNVAVDTVINITVYPRMKPRFQDLRIDKTKFIKSNDPEIEGISYYFNESDGRTIVVDGDIVSQYQYGPTKADQQLRCSGLPNSRPKG